MNENEIDVDGDEPDYIPGYDDGEACQPPSLWGL